MSEEVKLKLKDFPDHKSFMREYQYLKTRDKVSYTRGRYKKDKSVSSNDVGAIKN